ncbi:hypothetical protein TI39_contig48g00011 [Zymoseptoria brevis]|uniref:Uncharacterized protein n=1 Tax=Zymoseptoria brevis TaxID=1047168 RepID=A0A0F4GZ25_9PEZI|nr:hypothetical protein TI39_contig48g00011 [Zymoseptoria brevis]
MDSMRHLSTSLPPASRQPAPAELLPDFKAAAQAVTTLYRNAANSQKLARQSGYQDALDDLLAFLDRGNLGLMDGEGWKVRQWATERLDGDGVAARQQTPLASGGMTDDEDETSTAKEEDKDDERGSSPEAARKPHPLAVSSSDLSEADMQQQRRVVSEPPVLAPQQRQQHNQSEFTFQSSHAYPSNHDREAGTDIEMEATTPPTFTSPSSAGTVRIIPRTARNRHGSRRTENRGPTLNFSLGAGAGGKRKMPYSEYFDIHGLNDGSDRKDGSGGGKGGKRSRQV